MKDFLNQILPPIHKIKELTLKKTENLPEIQSERSAVFDIYFESETGSKFIVEMQKAKIFGENLPPQLRYFGID